MRTATDIHWLTVIDGMLQNEIERTRPGDSIYLPPLARDLAHLIKDAVHSARLALERERQKPRAIEPAGFVLHTNGKGKEHHDG